MALDYVPEQLLDLEICLEAVKQDGGLYLMFQKNFVICVVNLLKLLIVIGRKLTQR